MSNAKPDDNAGAGPRATLVQGLVLMQLASADGLMLISLCQCLV